ncbi:MAG: hypothetical protein K2H92_00115 [Bacteroidaceae bacterium]|nr:hypothetical protein [Bacteroidaceae bacterium]
MSPTSTNRSPRHRLVGVGDSDLEAVEAHHTQTCKMTNVDPSDLWGKETSVHCTEVREAMKLLLKSKPVRNSNKRVISLPFFPSRLLRMSKTNHTFALQTNSPKLL